MKERLQKHVLREHAAKRPHDCNVNFHKASQICMVDAKTKKEIIATLAVLKTALNVEEVCSTLVVSLNLPCCAQQIEGDNQSGHI